MEGQLRYGTYKIWDGFKEHVDYSFNIKNELNNIFYTITINKISSESSKEVLNRIVHEIKSKNEIFHEYPQPPEVIYGLNAEIVRVNYKEKSSFSDLETKEIVLLANGKEVIAIVCYTFDQFFNNGLPIWQAFYRSFRTDHSQPYKLKFGSFVPPAGMEDDTQIVYSLPNQDGYSISIDYIKDKDEEQLYIDSYEKKMALFLTDCKFEVDKKEVSISGRKAIYMESTMVPNKKPQYAERSANLYILDGISPGLEIAVNSTGPTQFNFYRGEMDDFFNSIKFDDQAK